MDVSTGTGDCAMAETDYECIVATAHGDIASFERLVKRYQKPLFNFILRYLADRPAAEDLTQEVFLRAFQAAGRFEPRASVSSWLFKIGYNLAMNELKRRGRFQPLSEEPAGGGGGTGRKGTMPRARRAGIWKGRCRRPWEN